MANYQTNKMKMKNYKKTTIVYGMALSESNNVW